MWTLSLILILKVFSSSPLNMMQSQMMVLFVHDDFQVEEALVYY